MDPRLQEEYRTERLAVCFTPATSIDGEGDAKHLFQCITTLEMDKVKEFLENFDLPKALEIRDLMDDQGHSVLH